MWNQEEHHTEKTFKHAYFDLLHITEIDYNDACVFEFYED
jgi:hypothetical protein